MLRQQPSVLKQKHPKPRFAVSDRLFWVMLQSLWSGWKQALVLVEPETVVRWHRLGFKMYWTRLSRHRVRRGRKRISLELRELIFRMVAENPTWVLLAFTANWPCLASRFRNERSCVGCAKRPGALSQQSDGLPF